MRPSLREKLESLFKQHPILVAGAVSEGEIRKLEEFAGHPLPESYKLFVRDYGGAIVGPYPVFGLRRSHPMGDNEDSAIRMTQFFKSCPWPGIEDWLIISSDLSGNPIGLKPDGEVWISDQEFNIIERVAADFEAFLEDVCLKDSQPERGLQSPNPGTT